MTSDGKKSWNKAGAEGIINTWEDSTLENYLNNDYLSKLGDSANLIETTTWHVGGFTEDQFWQLTNNKTIYNLELISSPIIDRKIGLMYASDYGYATDPIYWNLNSVNYFNVMHDVSKYNWMLTNTLELEWTISRVDQSSNAFVIKRNGDLDYRGIDYDHSPYMECPDVRPSFSLKSSVKLASGSGTSTDPYIVEV